MLNKLKTFIWGADWYEDPAMHEGKLFGWLFGAGGAIIYGIIRVWWFFTHLVHDTLRNLLDAIDEVKQWMR
ncbi:hypothetical protein [Chlorobium sp.]|uniref:hypothetical protein n=1 Tax=Chlorobium sp. TaxID=1095 RepID=UPI003C610A06